MTDIQIGLTIKDEPGLKDGQLGCAIAAELPAKVGEPITAHLEAYGFDPSSEGALRLASLLRDMAEALEQEVAGNGRTMRSGVAASRPKFEPRPLGANK